MNTAKIKWKLTILAIIAVALTSRSQSDLNTKSSTNTQISEHKEQALGHQTVAQLRRQVPFIEDFYITNYINTLGEELAQYIPIGLPYHFHLLKSDEINAFAVQGGFIFFFTGLINSMESQDELIGVMAHEMAHVKQRHIARMMKQHALLDTATMAALLGAAILGNAELTNNVGLIATNMNVDAKLSYSREFEQEADRVGFEALEKADKNPSGMIKFFETLNAQHQKSGLAPPEYLSTHPLSLNRMSDLKARINQSFASPLADTLTFDILRARIAALYSEKNARKRVIDNTPRLEPYIRALDVATPLNERISILDEFYAQFPNEVFILDKAVAYSDHDFFDKARAILKSARPNFPLNPEIPYQLGIISMAAANWQQACDDFASMRQYEYAYIGYNKQLSRCQYELGNEALSHYYLGNYYRLISSHTRAKEQYDLALNSNELSNYHRALAQRYRDNLKIEKPKR